MTSPVLPDAKRRKFRIGPRHSSPLRRRVHAPDGSLAFCERSDTPDGDGQRHAIDGTHNFVWADWNGNRLVSAFSRQDKNASGRTRDRLPFSRRSCHPPTTRPLSYQSLSLRPREGRFLFTASLPRTGPCVGRPVILPAAICGTRLPVCYDRTFNRPLLPPL